MKPTGLHCPHCHLEFNEDQVKRLWAEFCGKKTSKAKARAAAANGKKGGRPVTYFQNVYKEIPASIQMVKEKLKQWQQRYVFDVELAETDDPVRQGFYLRCDNILWHIQWNDINNHVEAFQDGRQVTGYNNINNSAKTSAKRLVEDIHRAKLISMPEDYSDIVAWIKQHGRR